MNTVRTGKNIEPTPEEPGHQYNWQHLVFVTKYRLKMFRNPKTVEVIRKAITEAAKRNRIDIREFAFGDDFAHIHIEVNVPNTLSIARAVQLLKGYSSYVVFKEIPRHRLRYRHGSFWSAGYSNSSVGPQDETKVRDYIRRQDVSKNLKP